MKQLFIQGRNGQVRQVGNNNHRAICCPGTLHPQGMKQILSSRSSSSVAVTNLSSKQCPNRALKLHEFHGKVVQLVYLAIVCQKKTVSFVVDFLF